MKTRLLKWVVFILCSQTLLSLTHESTFTQKQGGFELSEQLLQGKQLQGLNERIGLNREGGENDIKHVRRAQKGKGVYGGADMVRRPRNNDHSGASTLLPGPSSLIAVTMVQVSVGLILAFLFFF